MPKHALIIEDNQNNINVLERLLDKEGLHYTSLRRPTLLEATVKTLDMIDIIFVDLEMPGVTGFQVKDWIRENDHFPNAPIVAYSVHISELNLVYEQGFDSFIGKPLNPDIFPRQLNEILNGGQVWEI